MTNVVLDAPIHPVEGGSANDYDYVAGDPINNLDLDGERCWTGVAWTERVSYQDKDGNWKTKTKEHCNSVAKGVKRNLRGASAVVAKGLKCAGHVVKAFVIPPSSAGATLAEMGAALGGAGAGILYSANAAAIVLPASYLAVAGGAVVVGGIVVIAGLAILISEC